MDGQIEIKRRFLGLMELYIGIVCIGIAAFLFKDGYFRIYRIFMLLGAGAGFYIAGMFSGQIPAPENYVKIAGAVLGGVYAYSAARTAERAIIVMGPPITIILGYEYILVSKGIDLLVYVNKIPKIPNLSNEAFQGLLLIGCTFMTLAARSYARKAVPIAISGLISGFLFVIGINAVLNSELPASGNDINLIAAFAVSGGSIGTQYYFSKKIDDQKLEDQIMKSDLGLATMKSRNEQAKGQNTIVVACPICSENTSHQVITRKEKGDGVDILAKCVKTNKFGDVCNNVQNVREVRSD